MSFGTIRCGPSDDYPYIAYTPPRILVAALPEVEQQIATQIESELCQLKWRTNWFADAVKLVEHTTELLKRADFDKHFPDHTGWRSVAARDGARTVFQFGRIRNGIEELVRRAPTLMQYVQWNKVELSKAMMSSYFPHLSGPEFGIDMQFSSSWERALATNSLWGDRYRYQYEGRYIDCSINRDSYLKLCSVMVEIGAAFEPAANYSEAIAQKGEAG
jgi:hypothetical protein